MNNLEAIRERLKQNILASGISYRELSLKIGRRETYIQQYIKYGLPKRLNEIDRKRICNILKINEDLLIDYELSEELPDKTIESGSTEQFVPISIYSSKKNRPRIGKLSLQAEELNFYTPKNKDFISIVRVEGDYMEPTLPLGAFILYDTSITRFENNGVYVFLENDTITVKRIQRHKNHFLLISSDNPHYASQCVIEQKIEILGRAVNALIPHPL